MIAYGYIPVIILVIDYIYYFVRSRRSGKSPAFNATLLCLNAAFIAILAMSDDFPKMSRDYAMIEIMITIIIGVAIQDLFKSLK